MDRYQRQMQIEEFGSEAQIKLSNASVLVIGAGGLGCPALLYLVGAGVGRIGIVDHDVVDITNLHRQVIFLENDILKNKSIIAAERLRSLNANIQIEAFPYKIIPSNGIELISQFDMVLDGSDNMPTRYLLSDVCFALNKTLIQASIFKWEIQLMIFKPLNRFLKNLRQLYPFRKEQQHIPSCNINGVLGPVSGIAGTMQALEAIKMITKIQDDVFDQILYFDARTLQSHFIEITEHLPMEGLPKSLAAIRDHDYFESCVANAYEIEWDELIHQSKEKTFFILNISSNSIKFSEIFSSYERCSPDALFPLVEKHSIEDIVIVCNKGISSKFYANQLKNKFPARRFYSLKGGIESIEEMYES
ncbi:MAG TPA: HesA/MoeB/ThiF family protein [Bacteroidia bacterium]|nr:HesA/MoeB/ThiF family protein [Bacteroidia bacterium]HNT79933.1 HesA/MoeB/ThiF family protein [Bacteroidia bacterium]